MNYAKNFSEAEYKLKEKRQRENRKPNALPDEDNLGKLRSYLLEEIKETVDTIEKEPGKITASQFVHLRKLCLTRVTLVNGRRGSEVARMLLKDFEDRDSWIENKELTAADKKLIRQYSITYIMGKGNSLVPVLLPRDSLKAMEMLTDSKIRRQIGVDPDNQFVFAYTRESKYNSTGFNEISDVCRSIGLPVITATSVRHRTSTIFWRMDNIDPKTVDAFMELMGHDKAIDKDIYAVPPALNTLKRVGPILQQLDQVLYSCLLQHLYVAKYADKFVPVSCIYPVYLSIKYCAK